MNYKPFSKLNFITRLVIFLLFVFILSLTSLFSQTTLYMPLEFQAAYEEGTRSFDGTPGDDYWQNKADYNIDVSVNPSNREVSGDEKIIYYNNSPDTLYRIVIRMYQNINKPGSSRDFTFNEKYFTNGIELNSLTVNSAGFDLSDTNLENTGTNLIIKQQLILPGSRTEIGISWKFEVPKGNFVRMGAYDSTEFFIAYWYPQVSVYDDISGWDLLAYTGATEFYNDFNNYDVNISVPNSFGVWATGELLNPLSVLDSRIYSRYKDAMASNKPVKIISAKDYEENKSPFNNSRSSNTWHFKAAGVSDFTFGLSDHYLWDGENVFDNTKNVFVSAVYDPASTQFYGVCDVAAQTVDMMSHQLPGTPFPFPEMTVFNGRGGMESPMMVNMGSNTERIWMVHTVVHEVAHSYFPFYMGINERRYAWMDEGWTQMLSEYIQYAIDTSIDFRKRNTKRFLDQAGSFDEVPLMSPSFATGNSYGDVSYFRPAAAYNILKELLDNRKSGLFKTALQEFIHRWKGRHPTPYDFFFTFDNSAGENLDWFWVPWFFEQGYPDLEIDSVYINNDIIYIDINKAGSLPVPVMLEVKASDGSIMNIYRPADVWKNTDELLLQESIDNRKIRSVALGNKYIPDADTTNNVWYVK